MSSTVMTVKPRIFRRGCVWAGTNTWYFRAGKDTDAIRLGSKDEIPTKYAAWVKALPLLFQANGVPLPTVPAPPDYIPGTASIEWMDCAWMLHFTVAGLSYDVQIGTRRKYPERGDAEVGARPLIRRLESGNWRSLLPEPTSSIWHKPEYTADEFTEKLAEQDGKCAICGCEPERLDYDHDHSTGTLRDLLCGPCNRAIGMMRDNPERLESAARYLRKHRERG